MLDWPSFESSHDQVTLPIKRPQRNETRVRPTRPVQHRSPPGGTTDGRRNGRRLQRSQRETLEMSSSRPSKASVARAESGGFHGGDVPTVD